MLSPENWIDNYSDYLYVFALRRVNNEEVALDLVQDTFLAALESKDRFLGNSSEKTWLTAILKNKIFDYQRKLYSTSTSSLNALTDTHGDAVFFNENGHWNPEEQYNELNSVLVQPTHLEQKELDQIIKQCINTLPLPARDLFYAKMIDEEETEKICKLLNITTTNFYVMMHRARLLVRSCIEKKYR